MIVVGIVLGTLSMFDLFGEQRLPIALLVSVMIPSVASAFLGPAFCVFPLPQERRRKIANRSLIVSIALIVIGFLGAYLHWLGARIEIILGVLIICFFYGSLIFKNKYEKWKVYTRSKYDALFLSLFDFVGIGSLALGFLFRVQHWPLAELLIWVGMTTLVIGVLAWNQKFKKEVVFRKETEDKLQESLEQIELQHQKLEEKQKEIIDSIRYARRIQGSLMPTEKYIDSQFKRLKK